MEGKIKLKRVDFRLKPESYSVNGEALNEPGKVVDYAFGHKRKEEEDDPLAKTPSAEISTPKEKKSKNPSVRKEIERIRMEMETEEKAEKSRRYVRNRRGKESADEAKVKSKRK